jgi:hypothetical protein
VCSGKRIKEGGTEIVSTTHAHQNITEVVKNVVERQEEDSLSLRLEAVECRHTWGNRHDAESAVSHKLVKCKIQEEDRAAMLQCNSSGRRKTDIKIISGH